MKRKLLNLFVCLLLGFCAVGQDSVEAQPDTSAEERIDEMFEDFEPTTSDAMRIEPVGDIYTELAEGSEELMVKQTEYALFSLEHRQKVFTWQLIAGKIIFVFVMLIVLSGLVLSFMHFYKGLKSGKTEEGTELEMSTSGVKINSSVIGLVILVLAIAFLYLYLVHVFPIDEMNVDSTYITE